MSAAIRAFAAKDPQGRPFLFGRVTRLPALECSCGAVYQTRADLAAGCAYVGRQEHEDGDLDLWTCRACRSTRAVPAPRAGGAA